MTRLICALLLANGVLADDIKFDRLATLDAPGSSVEIIKYAPAHKLLLGTDSVDRMLDVFRVESFDPPAMEPIARVAMPGEPTSVAVHPDGSCALITVVRSNAHENGTVQRMDLVTRETTSWPVGFHPDSVAISPDGKWAVVANEGEGDEETPGSIGILSLPAMTYRELPGLGELLGLPADQLEPEFVAFDPGSRFAVVSCQENDAVVLVDLQADPPALAGKILLPDGSEPDGVDILDDIVGVAEEKGQSASFHRVEAVGLAATFLSRVDVRPLVDPEKPEKTRQPESIKLAHLGGGLVAFVGIERGDQVLCLDLSDPSAPRLAGHAKTGDRPEGLIVVSEGASLYVITGDEGKDGNASVTFSRAARKN